MTNDLISRDALMQFAHNHINGTIDCNDIARFPAVDAAPMVHGRWIEHVHVDEYGDCICIDYECSACHVVEHFEDDDKRAFCPNCGAKMDEEE